MSSVFTDAPRISSGAASVVPTTEQLRDLLALSDTSDDQAKSFVARVETRDKLWLGALSDYRLKVVRKIPVEFERADKSVVAKWDELDEFGYGANCSEALDDLRRTLTELYFSLHEPEIGLGSDLIRIRSILDSHVRGRASQQ